MLLNVRIKIFSTSERRSSWHTKKNTYGSFFCWLCWKRYARENNKSNAFQLDFSNVFGFFPSLFSLLPFTTHSFIYFSFDSDAVRSQDLHTFIAWISVLSPRCSVCKSCDTKFYLFHQICVQMTDFDSVYFQIYIVSFLMSAMRFIFLLKNGIFLICTIICIQMNRRYPNDLFESAKLCITPGAKSTQNWPTNQQSDYNIC